MGFIMPKFHVNWKLNPHMTPASAEEKVKLWLSMLEMVKIEMQTGKLVDWGNCSDGSAGYAIWDGVSEEELFTSMLKWMPYVDFDSKSVLSVDQTINSIKRAQAAAHSK